MRILFLTVLAALAGCATAPTDVAPTTATAAATAPAPAATAPDASAAAPAAAATTANAAVATGQEKQEFQPPPGYKAKIQDWGIVYCRKMPVLGSRFPKEVCMNEAQLKEHMANNEAFGRDKDQVSRVCGGVSGACGNE
jgi:hypothetical protein